jgi:hypothetical protein
MKHVFIAIGGSGTKVAEALIRLLAIGFPTKAIGEDLTSAGDSLEIWRVDTDKSNGAADSLQNALNEYAELQRCLNNTETDGKAASNWAMEIETTVRHLNPLELPNTYKKSKKLSGILDSGHSAKSTKNFLTAFYTDQELNTAVDRGFYQKPHLGAAVMSIFAQSLNVDSTPGGKVAALGRFDENATNFFLCGSLHGGTGACGVPMIGQFLKSRKLSRPSSSNWRIGGCLLAPYAKPSTPPIAISNIGEVTESKVEQLAAQYSDHPAFSGLNDEEKKELVYQIINGFYANPEDMEIRAAQGLTYYKEHGAELFDELYLVGKSAPDRLPVWSNGGKNQSNPLNSSEVVAALDALNFFAQALSSHPRSYIINHSNEELDTNVRLGQLPVFKIQRGAKTVDIEKVFLSTALLYYLLLNKIPWDITAKLWTDSYALRAVYYRNEPLKTEDERLFRETARLLRRSMEALINPNATLGWNADDFSQLSGFLTPNPNPEIERNLERVARDPIRFGNSIVKLTSFDFISWASATTQFNRGDYLRRIWNEIYKRCGERLTGERN